jgi:DNA-binding MarR family transcriptional regulator
MKPDDTLLLDNQLCFALYATTRAVMQAYEPLLSKLGVTYPQYLALLVLWQDDGVTMKALGERLYLDSGTLTPLLRRMDEAGLVTRNRSEKDERVVEVWLTLAGKRLKKQAFGVPAAMFCKSGMSPPEYLRLRNELRTIFERLRRHAA